MSDRLLLLLACSALMLCAAPLRAAEWQAVERVDHRASIDDLIAIGRDIEAQVLARAVNAIGERRVFLNGGKTLVFR